VNATTTDFEDIVISGIEATSGTARRLPKINIQIGTMDNELIPLDALVLKHIAAPLNTKNHNVQIKNMPHLSELKLAHPINNPGPFSVDILIAADVYWTLVEDEVIRGNGPTAIKSKVGYLLSGPVRHTSN